MGKHKLPGACPTLAPRTCVQALTRVSAMHHGDERKGGMLTTRMFRPYDPDELRYCRLGFSEQPHTMSNSLMSSRWMSPVCEA